MKIVLTMAGQGQRFKDAGYSQEKYEIDFQSHTLFEWSLISLRNFRESELVVVTRAFPDIENRILKYASSLGFASTQVIVLDRNTGGQAETACLAAPAFQSDDSMLVFNTDTFVDPDVLRPERIRGTGWIPCFEAPGDKWSFAVVDENDCVLRTTEKERVSDLCSVGLYYFDSFRDYVRIAEQAEEVRGERYIAPLYNPWIAEGKDVYVERLPSESVMVLGTPEDLAVASQRKDRWPS
jgi:dTDP-glucose pyrophosphorylase